jgi:hypothetical protein
MGPHTLDRNERVILGPCISEGAQELVGSKARATVMPSVTPHVAAIAGHERWGVVLAGGAGVRLRPLTQVICGDERPKRFCSLFEGKTLLAQTLR